MRQILKMTLMMLTAMAIAMPISAGIYFEQTITSEGDGQGMEMRVRGWADGENAKIEYLESNNPIAGSGTYLLTADGGNTIYLVNPEEQTYSEWDIAMMFSLLGQMSEMTGGLVNLEFKDPVSETLGSQPGGTVLGYPTTHYTWRSGLTMEMKVAFVNRSDRSVTTTNAWVTQGIHEPGLFAWLRATPPSTGDETLDRYLRDEMDKADGLVLKMDQQTTTTSKRGRESTTTSRFEVTTLREETIEAAVFALPTGYTKTQLMPEMAGLEGSGEGEQGVEAEEVEGPGKRLRGLLGRQ